MRTLAKTTSDSVMVGTDAGPRRLPPSTATWPNITRVGFAMAARARAKMGARRVCATNPSLPQPLNCGCAHTILSLLSSPFSPLVSLLSSPFAHSLSSSRSPFLLFGGLPQQHAFKHNVFVDPTIQDYFSNDLPSLVIPRLIPSPILLGLHCCAHARGFPLALGSHRCAFVRSFLRCYEPHKCITLPSW